MINPFGSQITITQGASSFNLILSDLSVSTEVEYFDRLEFSNDRLRQAKYSSGAVPIYITLFGGIPAQVTTTCGGSLTPRPLTPDDANVDNIKQRKDIRRYTLKGLSSLQSNVTNVYNIAQAHKILQARFDFHQAQLAMDISDIAIIALQAETFSYLTTTGITMSGAALDQTETNVLIRSFSMPVDSQVDTPALVLKTWEAVVDIVSIVSQADTSY